MFEIKEKFSLKNYNTFATDLKCAFFSKEETVEGVVEFLSFYKQKSLPLLILGGGSNILFKEDFEGFVLQPAIKGIRLLEETDSFVRVEAGAGEEWDCFVEYCVNNGWGGVENLSLIPGSVGATPIQNIGAYGVEIKDVLYSVELIELDTLKIKNFSKEDCKLGYRDSVFKNELKGKYIVTNVVFQLDKNPVYKLNYGNLKNEISRYGDLSLKNIRQAVMDIRNSKLPNVKDLGNAGSFFKNPVIEESKADDLKEKYPDIPLYLQKNTGVKIPAGWLIEKAGWKGERKGDVGVHEKQALVLVNYGNATGKEILHFARNIQQSIVILFGIDLEMEVNVV